VPSGAEQWERYVHSLHPALRFIRTTGSYGIARANNSGFNASHGQYIVFIHDDLLILQKDWLNTFRRILDEHPEVGMVGGSEAKFIDRSPEEASWIEAGLKECDWAPTLSMVRRCHLEQGLLFDEFYRVGMEDKDWALQFRRQGLKVAYIPIAHHHIGCQGSYVAFFSDRSLLDGYTKEGVRERYFLEKNKDVLKPEYYTAQMDKWSGRDRDWRRTWWMKLYLKYYIYRIVGVPKQVYERIFRSSI